MEVAHLIWRITGDPDDAQSVTWSVRLALRETRFHFPFTVRVLALLADLGPHAADAADALCHLLTTDRRPVMPGDSDSIPNDDELCRVVRDVLAGHRAEVIAR
ncbi:hypothetical protein ACWCXH_37975 [Kitasatospora sp. NPDC001660]